MRSCRLISIIALFFLNASTAFAEFMKGAAFLGAVSPVVKITRQENNLDQLVEGEVLYIFTEKGEAVAQVTVRNVFSDEVMSEPLPNSVAAQIRASGAILVYSNLREYGDFIQAYLNGSEEAFRDFVARYPRSELREEAERVIDGIIYRPYKLRGTVEAYNDFLEWHPKNTYAAAARQRRDALVFMPVRQADRASVYAEFIASHPESSLLGEAGKGMEAFRARFEEVTLPQLAAEPARMTGRKVRFACRLQSVLPIYLEGQNVGRRGAGFTSPRNSSDHLNFQVRAGEMVLWRLFIPREATDLADRVERMTKQTQIMVYGEVFDASGNAPWIDVMDVEVF